MKRLDLRIIALVLAVTVLFSGCGILDFQGYFDRLAQLFGPVSFKTMNYTRPDLSTLDGTLDDCINSARRGDDLMELVGHITSFNSIYNSFQTNYLLAYVHYSIDMTDTYWETEYTYCAQQSPAVNAAAEELMYVLADCPLRDELEGEEYFGDGYFDDYDGESFWTEEFTALMEQETELVNRYYDLSSQALAVPFGSEVYYSVYGIQMEELFVELITLRQQMATLAGYGSYPEFAYDFYFSRDYTPVQSSKYLNEIQNELVPLYKQLEESNVWDQADKTCTEQQTFGYVRKTASAMGGMIEEAFDQMETAGLYHISAGENKYNGSFEVFFPDYMVPFVFMNPEGNVRDQLTFTHEFGHFCNDYASNGTMVGVDVAEVFSQGLEYLSLCATPEGSALTELKMADSLCVFVEQAAFASFEQQVYNLKGDALTVENLRKVFAGIAGDYGFGDYVDSRGYVTVGHFFTSPMYVISYVVSNDVALQLYQMEKATGTGLGCYTGSLATAQEGLLAFVAEAGLESPFAAGRIRSVKETFRQVL